MMVAANLREHRASQAVEDFAGVGDDQDAFVLAVLARGDLPNCRRTYLKRPRVDHRPMAGLGM